MATERISVSSGGQEQDRDGSASGPAISADGRYIAFESHATNLVGADDNDSADVFLRDRVIGTTILITLSSEGGQGNESSDTPSISASGHRVAFISLASNLVAGDTDGEWDVFVRDVVSETTTLASVRNDGSQGTRLSFFPEISADGRYVTFESSGLVSPDINGDTDVYVRDLLLGTTELASVDSSGGQMLGRSFVPSISGDGRFVAFQNQRGGDIQIWVNDRATGATSLVSARPDGLPASGGSFVPTVSADGSWVAFASRAPDLVTGDTNELFDVFLRNRGDVMCPNGVREEGALSKPLHDTEDPSGPAAPAIHEGSCTAARWGL